MCGITGFAERNHKAETARRIVKGMADLITYRGPDGEGYYVDDQVALGHRRLSIIDLEGGKQPMFNEDGSLVCIFNGEIYNFIPLPPGPIPRCCCMAMSSGAISCPANCAACSPS